MDEFNRDFDPNNEYMSLDTDENTPVTDTAKEEIAPQETDEPVKAENVEDDVFEAFEKASNTPSPYSSTIPQPAPIPAQNPVGFQPQGYYQASPTVPYGAPVAPQQHSAPQYTAPQYMPRREQAPAYQPPAPPYQQPVYNNQQRTAAPYQQYRQPQPVPPQQYNPYSQGAPTTQQSYNPYAPAPAVKKEKTPKKTKVLIGVLIGLLIVFVVGFAICCFNIIFDGKGNSNGFSSDNPLSQYATEAEDYNFDEYFGDDYYGNFYDNFGIAPQYSGDEFDEKVTLQADEGQTQMGSNSENNYAPNEKAEGIVLNELPKDKTSEKYTAQSAYNTVTDAVVSIVCYEGEITDNAEDVVGEGTGTIISSDGYIVTNSHVIGDTNDYAINVVLNNSKEYKASIVGFDSRTDLAVLKIDAKDLTYAKFSDSSYVEVGQDIVAIGNPGGQSFQNSLTKGIVSAVDRELDLNTSVKYIQLDAAINPGNSGGPLCNLYGQVIGINTAKIASEEYEGMGFAIPSSTVKEIANDLIRYGYVKDRVMLGLVGLQVTDEMTYNYNVPYGILITEITEGGPLDNTDIKEYDILTAINDVEVTSFQDVYAELAKYAPGDKVTLTLYRLEE